MHTKQTLQGPPGVVNVYAGGYIQSLHLSMQPPLALQFGPHKRIVYVCRSCMYGGQQHVSAGLSLDLCHSRAGLMVPQLLQGALRSSSTCRPLSNSASSQLCQLKPTLLFCSKHDVLGSLSCLLCISCCDPHIVVPKALQHVICDS